MPILVKESPEPFTFGSLSSPSILAECDAYRCLLSSILRYGRREIMGRSVLISGHRGSGKTTLVRWAVEHAQKKLAGVPNAARPLLVPLHGPDLLGGESVLSTGEKPKDAPAAEKTERKDAPAAEKTERDDSDTRAALRLLAKALHRAYVSELGRALIEQTAGDPGHHELAAQLIVELDHAPDLDVLRYFWEKTGKLQSGVLFPSSAGPRDPRQGYRELLAAGAVIEGYRVVAGKLENSDRSSRQSERSEQSERKTNYSGKDFLNPLVGLLAGGAAGAGVLMSGAGGALKPFAAALAGILTAVGGASVLNYSSSRSTKQSRESQFTFTWDTSIASLDRMLPVMVDRIVDAGLAPIFVVDELDKIPDLENKMEHLIRHLKHLVTEKTFFCFLTERSYFEHVVSSSRTKVYGREHTFFSDRLFVHYSPADMHKYLFQTLGGDNLDDNEKLDRLVLPFFLLERSKMHPIDLRRALSDFTDPHAAISLPVGTVRQPEGYGMAVFMQVAVEAVLGQENLRSRLAQDPNFARMAYDALYLPARSWESGDDCLTLNRETLRAAIEARMAREGQLKSDACNLSDADLDLLQQSASSLIDYLLHPDKLVQSMLIPATGPSTEKNDSDEYKTYRVTQRDAVRDVVPVTQLMLSEIDSDGNYRWLRDPFGAMRRPHPPAPPRPPVPEPKAAPPIVEEVMVGAGSDVIINVPPPYPAPPPAGGAANPPWNPPANPTWNPPASPTWNPPANPPAATPPPEPQPPARPSTAELIGQIQGLNSFVRSVSGQRLDLDKLATQIHLLSISPAWPSVENAIRAFEAAGSPDDSDDTLLLSHRSLIDSYAQMANSAVSAIRRAFILASLMTVHMAGSSFPRLLERAMQLLAADLRFAKSDIRQINSSLTAFDKGGNEMAAKMAAPLPRFELPETPAWRDQMSRWMKLLSSKRGDPPPPIPISVHHDRWQKFLLRHLRGGSTIFYQTLDDLLLRAAGWALPFPTDWSEVTYLHFARALRGDPPPVLRSLILVELGFAKEIASTIPLENCPPELLDLLEICVMPGVQRSGERVLLAIGGSAEKRAQSPEGDTVILMEEAADSIAAGWRPSLQHAVVPVFASDINNWTNQIKEHPTLALRWCLFENEWDLPSIPPHNWTPSKTYRLTRVPSTTGLPDLASNVIASPPSLDAAMDEARKRNPFGS